MFFHDRRDAGRQIISLLDSYLNNHNAIVVGLPRGGVETAYEIAHGLKLPLDIVSPRKVGAPGNPELAIGAVTETGEGVFNEELIQSLGVSPDYLHSEIANESEKAKERLKQFRKDLPTRNLKGKTIILVDDGIATGATMMAAIKSVRHEGADKIVVAVPVGPLQTIEALRDLVDEVICLYTPEPFGAVGYFYENFSQTEDAKVSELLKKAHEEHGLTLSSQ